MTWRAFKFATDIIISVRALYWKYKSNKYGFLRDRYPSNVTLKLCRLFFFNFGSALNNSIGELGISFVAKLLFTSDLTFVFKSRFFHQQVAWK